MSIDIHPSTNPCTEIISLLQRDLNCLLDSSRTTRTLSLERIKKRFFPITNNSLYNNTDNSSIDNSSIKVLLTDVYNIINSNIIKLLDDQYESCRLLTIELNILFYDYIDQPERYLKNIAIISNKRLGTNQMIEPSEEIRLKMINLLIKLIKSGLHNDNIEIITNSIDMILNTVYKTTIDPYPELKQESCKLIDLLCDVIKHPNFNYDMSNNLTLLASSLNSSLSHQRYSVRVNALETLFSILMADTKYGNNDFRSWTLPYLDIIYGITQDRAPAVRTCLLICCVKMLKFGLSTPNKTKILICVLAALVDTVEAVQIKASESLVEISNYYNLSLVEIIKECLNELMPVVFVDLSDWTSIKRTRGLGVLHTILKYCPLELIPSLPNILASLGRISHDDDPNIRNLVINCSRMIGESIDIKYCVNIIFSSCGICPSSPTLSNYSFVAPSTTALQGSMFPTPVSIHSSDDIKNKHENLVSSAQIANALSILAGLVLNTNCDLTETCKYLTHSDLCCHESAVVRLHVFSVVQNLLNLNNSSLQTCFENLFWILLQLSALSEDIGTTNSINSCYEKMGTIESIFKQHFRFALNLILTNNYNSLPTSYVVATPHYEQFHGASTDVVEPVNEYDNLPSSPWIASSPQRYLFSALCRYSIPFLTENIDVLLPVFAAMANPRSDSAIRISCLAIIQAIFESSAEFVNFSYWVPWIETVFRDVIFAGLSWRSGRVAATIRLQCLKASNAIFSRNIVQPELLTRQHLFSNLLLSFSTSLDDFDPPIRLNATLGLHYILSNTTERLDDIAAVDLYRELLKRLDDSHDEIRIAVCQTLIAFLNVVNLPTFDKSSYKYLIHGFLVHLDDPNPSMKDAAFNLLVAWKDIDTYIFFPEVQAVRDKHTNPSYCDRLLALAK